MSTRSTMCGIARAVREGILFSVEPMTNAGRYDVKILSDGWITAAKGRSLSAQFEHTIGVTCDRLRDLHDLAPACAVPYPWRAGPGRPFRGSALRQKVARQHLIRLERTFGWKFGLRQTGFVRRRLAGVAIGLSQSLVD